ncbi:MAG: hypothetical protein WEB03_10470 [Nitriliruptor sp.]|uniref:hypothetical protein n=1 Tax=Nitriliruptor sp. TaxID=2448056 RepID=UPI0034A029DF
MAEQTADARVVLVTARLLDDEQATPGFVAFDPEDAGRPVGEDRTASGWELYVGAETDAELEDADNARLVDVTWAIERFPDLQVLLDEHDGSTPAAWLATGDGDWLELDDDDLDGLG